MGIRQLYNYSIGELHQGKELGVAIRNVWLYNKHA